jgi:hypothetical protein
MGTSEDREPCLQRVGEAVDRADQEGTKIGIGPRKRHQVACIVVTRDRRSA